MNFCCDSDDFVIIPKMELKEFVDIYLDSKKAVKIIEKHYDLYTLRLCSRAI